MKKCTFCAEQIQDEAIKCRFCGEFFDGSKHPVAKEERSTNLGIAALLSILIPGAGQMYRGQIGAGIALMTLICLSYAIAYTASDAGVAWGFIAFGILIHLASIRAAAHQSGTVFA